jgi:hypothetical protein
MSFDDPDFTSEEHERRIVRCTDQLCRQRIIFLPTPNGKQMPCDADSVEPADKTYDPVKHASHFVTCKNPNRFRNKKGPRP